MDAGIGNFGQVVFTVSAEQVRTFENFRRTSVAVFADHEVIFGKPASEFTGEELDGISFTMSFNAELGVNPAEEADTLREMKSTGNAHVLVIGGLSLGWWTIREVGELVHHTMRGRPTVSSVDISIKEYTMQPTPAASAAMARDQSTRGVTGRGGPEKVPGAKPSTQSRDFPVAR
jgi:phage protein U